MKNFATKQILAGTLVGVSLGGSAAMAASMYRDVPNDHWASPAIEWATNANIMTGPGDQQNVFEPAKPTNRAELAAVSMRLYNLMSGEMQSNESQILDLRNRVEDLEDAWEDWENDHSSSSMSSVQTSFDINLSGSQEVPAVSTTATGEAELRWTSQGLVYDIEYENLSSDFVGAHFHSGAEDENGPVLFTINFSGQRAQGVWEISEGTYRALLDSGLYINIHSEDYPDGELRGQVD